MVQIAFPDLKMLAEFQDKLDKRVEKLHGITEDMTNERIIAFKVEFGEFLNEHKFFKFWKKEAAPNVRAARGPYMDLDDADFYNPLLEEYVDGIHFLLSIGNKRKYTKFIHTFHAIEHDTEDLTHLSLQIFNNPINSAGRWLQCFNDYLYLGHLVGIGAEEIEQAYLLKNKINHDRQTQGY